jgi:oleate hydratase
MRTKPKAYLVGGGIGSLAAAAFMIRDGKLPGENISILEKMPVGCAPVLMLQRFNRTKL